MIIIPVQKGNNERKERGISGRRKQTAGTGEENAGKRRGYGTVFVITDWSNLNTEKWYVITAGTYGTEEAASAVLPDVQRVCSNAYIKYSGNWQG